MKTAALALQKLKGKVDAHGISTTYSLSNPVISLKLIIINFA
jgi:hypothetical protein